MQIRRIIFISCILLILLITLPLMTVLFFSSRNTIEQEISLNIHSDAMMLMEEVDMLMFERLQNVNSWSHLDIMQEARIGDVDKRLSQFLADVEMGYKGMYHSVFYVNVDQRIVAASVAGLINQVYDKKPIERMALMPNGRVFIDDSQVDQVNLSIQVPVQDNYSGNAIGQLYGLFNMQQLQRLLSKASRSSTGDRYIVLLNNQGQVIAASENLTAQNLMLSNVFADWRPVNNASLIVHSGQPITKTPLLLGYAASTGYLGYAQMGWSIMILQSTAEAFLPIDALFIMFSIVIILTLVLVFLTSHWLSGYIATPLLSLTAWVRDMQFSEKVTQPGIKGTVEVNQLADAFYSALQELEQSREQVIQTAKLAVIGEMSATMAHEIRTPVGIISTSAQLLSREHGLSAEGKEMSGIILDESQRLRKLVTTLLECARPRQPCLQMTNIHELINHALDLLASQAAQKQINRETDFSAESVFIPCDADLMTQVLLNLLLNAIQILPPSGLIHIQTRLSSNLLILLISDNG